MKYKPVTRYLLISVLIILFIYYVFEVAVSPVKYMHKLDDRVAGDSVFISGYRDYPPGMETDSLIRLKSQYTALLALSKMDSIQMVLDLDDSTVQLHLKGIRIFSAGMEIKRRDPVLDRLSNRQYEYMFSRPLEILQQRSGIVKEPIVVRHAPKDTIEAALNAFRPDTLIQNPAFLWINTGYNIRVIFEQEGFPSFSEKWKHFRFRNALRISGAAKRIANLILFRDQEYTPVIIVRMNADDLRIIYRALPENAYLVIRI